MTATSLGIAACAVALAFVGLGCGEAAAPRALLLVSVDTLRADQLGSYGGPPGLTPHLDALARESVLFERAYAPAPLTLPSMSALFTGRYPEELGMRDNEARVPRSVATLATELSASGWRTGAVVGNYVLRREAGLARGFDLFDDELPEREAVRRWPERSATDATDRVLEMFEGCMVVPGNRCFLWVHYQDPHGPYTPPEALHRSQWDVERASADGLRRLPAGRDDSGRGAIPAYQFVDGRHDVAWYRAGYRAEIRHMDAEVGRLLAAIDGWRGETVVVFTADHGEALGEGDVWFAHGEHLTDDQVRVPLLLRVPGTQAARRGDAATLVDLLPTLLALATGAAPEPGLAGRDLLAPGADRESSRAYLANLDAGSVRRWGWVDDGYKLVLGESAEGEQVRLFALGREDTDLARESPDRVAALRARVEAFRGRVAGVEAAERQELGPAERERLRALGYSSEPDAP